MNEEDIKCIDQAGEWLAAVLSSKFTLLAHHASTPCCYRKEREMFTLVSNDNRSLLRRPPGAMLLYLHFKWQHVDHQHRCLTSRSIDIPHDVYKLLWEVPGTDLIREDSLAGCLCNGLQEVWEASKA